MMEEEQVESHVEIGVKIAGFQQRSEGHPDVVVVDVEPAFPRHLLRPSGMGTRRGNQRRKVRGVGTKGAAGLFGLVEFLGGVLPESQGSTPSPAHVAWVPISLVGSALVDPDPRGDGRAKPIRFQQFELNRNCRLDGSLGLGESHGEVVTGS